MSAKPLKSKKKVAITMVINDSFPAKEEKEEKEVKEKEEKEVKEKEEKVKEEKVKEEKEKGEKKTVKKSSHKKKTTKWIVNETPEDDNENIGNIILHLNCFIDELENYKKTRLKDPLEYNPEIPLEIQTFEAPNQFAANNQYEVGVCIKPSAAYQYICHKCNEQQQNNMGNNMGTSTGNNMGNNTTTTTITTTVGEKEDLVIQSKLRELKIKYFMNNIEWSKATACFWCTCEFENTPFYLPQLETKDKIVVYGSFCSPQCAVAYLFKETIDDNMKFERYHLMNKLYKPLQGNIRPAPNPFYLLDKFLGNLSIQEYRRLLNLQQHQYIIQVDKPMTRVLPELHSEGETVSNISAYKIKRQSEQLPLPLPQKQG